MEEDVFDKLVKIEEYINQLKKENEELKNKKYVMSISCDGQCQICEHYKNEYLLEVENRQLKKGINTLIFKRKKWKDRYYKLKTENLNITRETLNRTDKLDELILEIKQIRDKAECMDYYMLVDVIDDLSKLIEKRDLKNE